ncbi:DUF4190 domain-containing protein [Alteribacter keqinensis]|uniref:DUF4190 domain-containing protein n=1 Tax=Alteribacter keqinensis TaxID=2483800 RepID=UPI002017DCAD|nr:DUF4190 domain-containing protein [Alteribacter keqinensis]
MGEIGESVEAVKEKVNGKAVASLVLGILSLIIPYVGLITGIIGIVLANLALKEIKVSSEGGRGLAVGGLTCSIIATVLYGILVIMLIAALGWVAIFEV